MKNIKYTLFLLILVITILFNNNLLVKANNTYFAIGDFSISGKDTYIEKLQNTKIKATTLVKKSYTGLRIEDLYYLLDEDEVRDAYGEDILQTVNKEEVISYLSGAEYISLSFNNMDFSASQSTALVPYEVNLNKYLTEEQIAEMEKLFNEQNSSSPSMPGMENNMTGSMESFLYNYLGSLYYATPLVDKILELNPNATIIFVGMYNPYVSLNFEIEGFKINMGEVFDAGIEFIDSIVEYNSSYLSKSVYVPLGKVETALEEKLSSSGSNPNYIQIFSALMKNPELTLPSDDGNEYIKETIINRLENKCNHEANQDDGDCTTEVTCKLCGIVMIDKMENHALEILPGVDPTCSANGLTEGSYCSICGKVISLREQISKLPHTYTSGCDEDCDVCGEKRTTDHSFGEWEVVKEATKKHEGEENRNCTICGKVEVRTIPTTKGCKKGSLVVFSSLLLTSMSICFVLNRKNK